MIWYILTIVILLILAAASITLNVIQQKKYLKTCDIIAQLTSRQDDIYDVLVKLNDDLKTIDLKGAFEADDEVGNTFKAIKELVSTAGTTITEVLGIDTETPNK